MQCFIFIALNSSQCSCFVFKTAQFIQFHAFAFPLRSSWEDLLPSLGQERADPHTQEVIAGEELVEGADEKTQPVPPLPEPGAQEIQRAAPQEKMQVLVHGRRQG